MTSKTSKRSLIELIERKNAAPEGSAARAFALRQIAGLRNPQGSRADDRRPRPVCLGAFLGLVATDRGADRHSRRDCVHRDLAADDTTPQDFLLRHAGEAVGALDAVVGLVPRCFSTGQMDYNTNLLVAGTDRQIVR